MYGLYSGIIAAYVQVLHETATTAVQTVHVVLLYYCCFGKQTVSRVLQPAAYSL